MTTDQTSFGKYLKAERDLRNISLDEIAQATKIKAEYLHSLEQDEFERLPNETFVKGYIRAYAKYCGMNEDEVLVNYEFFDQCTHGPVPDEIPEQSESKPLAQKKWLFYCIIVTVTLIISFICAYLINH